ncbi:MAG: hypothetical protein ACLTZU_00190 [Odoribacter splanchnicus]
MLLEKPKAATSSGIFNPFSFIASVLDGHIVIDSENGIRHIFLQ